MKSSFKTELIRALPRARKYAHTLVKSSADADDLLQEAIERALHNSRSFKEGSNLNAWLNRIIKNIFLDEQKSHRVSRTTLVGSDEAGVLSNSSRGGSMAIEKIEIAEIQSFLFTLPEAERTIVMLWAEGYSYEEIAAELGITRNNAAVILCRARKVLHERFKG